MFGVEVDVEILCFGFVFGFETIISTLTSTLTHLISVSTSVLKLKFLVDLFFGAQISIFDPVL